MNYLILESKLASPSSIAKRKPVLGRFINDAPFNVSMSVSGGRINHEGYQAWVHMLHRCYGKVKEQFPSYNGVEVCREWHRFMAFRTWWITSYKPGFCLDKDLLGSGKLYSPETCLYIPQGLNKLLNTSMARRGAQPLGVTFFNGKYRAYVRNPVSDTHEFLGDFDTPEQAHATWRNRKNEILEMMRPLMDSLDRQIYPAVKNKIAEMR